MKGYNGLDLLYHQGTQGELGKWVPSRIAACDAYVNKYMYMLGSRQQDNSLASSCCDKLSRQLSEPPSVDRRKALQQGQCLKRGDRKLSCFFTLISALAGLKGWLLTLRSGFKTVATG